MNDNIELPRYFFAVAAVLWCVLGAALRRWDDIGAKEIRLFVLPGVCGPTLAILTPFVAAEWLFFHYIGPALNPRMAAEVLFDTQFFELVYGVLAGVPFYARFKAALLSAEGHAGAADGRPLES